MRIRSSIDIDTIKSGSIYYLIGANFITSRFLEEIDIEILKVLFLFVQK